LRHIILFYTYFTSPPYKCKIEFTGRRISRNAAGFLKYLFPIIIFSMFPGPRYAFREDADPRREPRPGLILSL
jgi:hypothetical protein